MMQVIRRRPLWLSPLVLLLGLLSGCQSASVKEEGSTGRLGEAQGPTQAQSAAAVYIQLAAEYLRQGKLTSALQNARKAVLVAPKDADSHNMLALVLQKLGEAQQAETHFAEAVRLDPQDPYSNNAYGSFLCGQKRYAEAQKYFDAAVANPLNPEPAVPLSNAGICAYQNGKYDVAESYLRKALRTNPKLAPALLHMGEISYAQGKYLSARAYLQRYAEVARQTAQTLWLGIRTERQLGDMDQVASYELLLRSKFPDSEEMRHLKESR
jgi:type IV pilus assembly protein PilF